MRHGQCAECLKITTAGSTGTHDRHVPSQWQATATTREHNLADRPRSIDRIDLLRPTSGDHKTFFSLALRSTLTNLCKRDLVTKDAEAAIGGLTEPPET